MLGSVRVPTPDLPHAIHTSVRPNAPSARTHSPRHPAHGSCCLTAPHHHHTRTHAVKKAYADAAGEETFKKYQTIIYLGASASAEVFADLALCPFEAVKVKVQTVPGWGKGLTDGFPKFIAENGVGGLYRGLAPLWGRQIPYTMMKFGAFENTVVALYKHVIPKPKSECSKTEQLGVSFLAGYIAGIFCATVSHPADNLVSKLNANKSATVSSVINDMGMYQLATRGLGLRIIMVGTLTGLQWGIYDAYKVSVGLPTTGSVAPPAK
jgi:solute carrier family 25 phosphate transporter 3